MTDPIVNAVAKLLISKGPDMPHQYRAIAGEIVALVRNRASLDRAWINGALYGWNCAVCCDDRACWTAIRQRQQGIGEDIVEMEEFAQ